ncbi:hypothetical protein ES288_A09G028300v1 [Gossypium darwinii]|uniref:Uncharacterized protein n=1 Tax=Gossypium darwinii TaxID=34276 RepID=A0A5D2F764_GOSDA|nr:hypothetical protein ES288_A09G028300v1 [Gossypium darwinii]
MVQSAQQNIRQWRDTKYLFSISLQKDWSLNFFSSTGLVLEPNIINILLTWQRSPRVAIPSPLLTRVSFFYLNLW